MQIHDLNTKALTDPAYVAFDDGTDTYKADFKAEIDNAAASAVADADLTDNTVAFTSGDAESPTTWTAVSVLTSGLTIKELFNRISTMIKNVRYIWNLLGSSSFSNVASTLTGAIGNTALTTTAQTLSGAIAEHERDISGLNSNLNPTKITFTPDSSYTSSPLDYAIKIGNICIYSFLGNFSNALGTWTDYLMGTFSVQAKYRALSVAVDNNMHPVSIQIDADSNVLKARPLAGAGHANGVRGQIIFIIK